MNRFVAIAIVAVVVFSLPNAARSQDRPTIDDLLAQLPEEPAIYLWIEDVEQFKSIVSEAKLVNESDLKELAHVPAKWLAGREGLKSFENINQPSQIDRVLELLDEDLIDGPVLWIRALNKTWGVRNTFIVHSNAEQETFRDLIHILNDLADPTKEVDESDLSKLDEVGSEAKDSSRAGDAAEAESDVKQDANNQPHPFEQMSYLPGVWTLENGWFVWSDVEDDLVRVLPYLNETKTVGSSLGESRNLKMVFANLPRESTGQPLFTFYVPAVAWPHLSKMGISIQPGWFRALWGPLWQGMVFDLPGLGVHVTYHSPSERKPTDPTITFEAMALLPQPKHPLADAFVNREFSAPQLPFLPDEQEAFLQLHVNGKKFAEGADGLSERFARIPEAYREFAIDRLNRFPAHPEIASNITPLVEPIDQVNLIAARVAPESFHFSSNPYEPLIYLRARNAADVETAIDSYLAEKSWTTTAGKKSENLAWGKKRDPTDTGRLLWRVTPEARQKQFDSVEESMSKFKEQMAKQREEFFSQEEVTEEQMESFDFFVRKDLEFLQKRYRQRIEQADSYWLAIDRWYLAHPVSPRHQELLGKYEDVKLHPQVAEILRDVKTLQNHFEYPEDVCGVISISGDGIGRKMGLIAGDEPEPRPYTGDDALKRLPVWDHTDEIVEGVIGRHRWKFAQRQVVERIDRVTVEIRSESRGLRFSGGIFSR